MFFGAEFRLVDVEAIEEALRALERVDPIHATAEMIRCELLSWEEKREEEKIECVNAHLARNDLTPAARAWAMRNRANAKSDLGQLAAAL